MRQSESMFSNLNPIKILKTILTNDLFLPLCLVLTYLIFLFIVRGHFPTSEELIRTFSRIYGRFGYEIIFLAAFLESVAVINLFTPGGVALALGVIFARKGEMDLIFVILFGSLGAISGYLIDYWLGFYGFSQVIKKLGYTNLLITAGNKLKRFGKRGLILGFIHSNIGSFLSISAGTISFPWKSFTVIMVVSTFFWASLWGIAIYAMGDIVLTILRRYGFLVIFFISAGVFLSKLWKEKE